jgi:hypothetical protein
MTELELNLENLFSLGLTPEILKNDFENWVKNNNDIIIDFKKNIIYTDIIAYKKELDYALQLIKNDLISNGYSIEEIENLLELKRNEIKERYINITNAFPTEEIKYEFNIQSIKKLKNSFIDLKDKFYDKKIDELLNFNDKIVVNENSENNNNQLIQENPYPRIFTSGGAYTKFKNLYDEFDKSTQDLANYSFVFHRMKKDNLIYKDLKQLEFIDFLSSFEIHLDRLKPISQLGNNDLREGIYNRI